MLRQYRAGVVWSVDDESDGVVPDRAGVVGVSFTDLARFDAAIAGRACLVAFDSSAPIKMLRKGLHWDASRLTYLQVKQPVRTLFLPIRIIFGLKLCCVLASIF